MKGQVSPEFRRAVEAEVRRLSEQGSKDLLAQAQSTLKLVERAYAESDQLESKLRHANIDPDDAKLIKRAIKNASDNIHSAVGQMKTTIHFLNKAQPKA